jgi:hypothetical protein
LGVSSVAVDFALKAFWRPGLPLQHGSSSAAQFCSGVLLGSKIKKEITIKHRITDHLGIYG